MNSKGARRPPAGRAQHHGDGKAEDGEEPQSLVTEDCKFFISFEKVREGGRKGGWFYVLLTFPSVDGNSCGNSKSEWLGRENLRFILSDGEWIKYFYNNNTNGLAHSEPATSFDLLSLLERNSICSLLGHDGNLVVQGEERWTNWALNCWVWR